MGRANEAVAREQRNAAVTELQHRVEDWKGHNMMQFGELLMYGNFTVLKGEGTKPQEREVCVIFCTFSPQLRLAMLYTFGQSAIMAVYQPPPEDHGAFIRKAHNGKINFIAPSEARQERCLKIAQSFHWKGYSPLLPVLPTPSPQPHSSESSCHAPGLPSPTSPKSALKSPSFKKTLLRMVKKSKPQGIQSPPVAIPQSFFNGPITGSRKLLHVDGEEHERRLNNTEISKLSKPVKHNHDPFHLERDCVKEEQLVNPKREQYIIYLFERILLCCKEVNPNKQRAKMLRNERAPANPLGKVRLQLKGRIFMQNVTDVLSFVRTGNVDVLIFQTQ